MPGIDLEADCALIAGAGFEAVEGYLGDDEAAVAAFSKAAGAVGLAWIAQIHTRRDGQADACDRLARHYRAAAGLGAILVNLHTGSDLLPEELNEPLFACARQLAEETGLPSVHETHRGRATWSVPATARLMDRHPDLRFCADLSHWCCVHESLLDRSRDVVERVLDLSLMVHARVGHSQGSQVADWRDPLCAAEFAAHLAWWDRAVAASRAGGYDLIICTEFGSTPYQPRLPYTGQPVSDGWDVNLSLMQYLRARYGGPQ